MALRTISNNSSRLNYILSVAALITGGSIYLFLRPAEPLFFQWIKWAGFESRVFSLRQYTLPFSSVLPEWFIYSLPNGLWAFAYSILILSVWKNNNSRIKYFWYSTIPVLIFGVEIFQFSGILPGTFCLVDIAFSIAGISAGYVFACVILKSNNHEK